MHGSLSPLHLLLIPWFLVVLGFFALVVIACLKVIRLEREMREIKVLLLGERQRGEHVPQSLPACCA